MALIPDSWLSSETWSPVKVAIGAGVLCAALSLLPVTFNLFAFFMNYFSPLPLYIVALCWNRRAFLLAAGITLAIILIFAGPQAAATTLCLTLFPAFFITTLIQKNETTGVIIGRIAGLALIAFAGVAFILMAQSINITEQLHSWLSPLTKQLPNSQINNKIIDLFPGISAISWIIMSIINASVGRRIANMTPLFTDTTPPLLEGRISENWDIILGFGLLLILTQKPMFAFIGENVALISCVPLYIMGLSVVNAWLQQFENPKLWLIAVVIVSFFLVWPGIIVVVFGVLESLLHLRQRWTQK